MSQVTTLKEDTDASHKENDLDPRIQEELEKLNTATDEINRLEIELDEANSTFRILMNESTRKLKQMARKLGNCIERARPYYEAVELSRQAQQECQRAAAKFQRANEIHQAAKETVALAEARFLSKQHEWEFDSAWQEMLNNAIMKVTNAENQKSECGREHHKKTSLFHAAEQKVHVLKQRCHRHIAKSRPYFEEKLRCDTQLAMQKERVLRLRAAISKAKKDYGISLRRLEDISEEIHLKRKRSAASRKSRSSSPCGLREPGVGAELPSLTVECSNSSSIGVKEDYVKECYINRLTSTLESHRDRYSRARSPSLDLDYDLDQYDVRSTGSGSHATSSAAVSDTEDFDQHPDDIQDLEELKKRVKELATMPVTKSDDSIDNIDRKDWEKELNNAVQQLDHVLQLKECENLPIKSETKDVT